MKISAVGTDGRTSANVYSMAETDSLSATSEPNCERPCPPPPGGPQRGGRRRAAAQACPAARATGGADRGRLRHSRELSINLFALPAAAGDVSAAPQLPQVSDMAQPRSVRRPPRPTTETVEEFLARGGRIEKITDYPDPEGRVMRRSSYRKPAGAAAPDGE